MNVCSHDLSTCIHEGVCMRACVRACVHACMRALECVVRGHSL